MALLAAASLALIAIAAAGVLDAAAKTTAQASRAKNVNIKNFAFSPKSVTVAKGTTVRFVNADGTAHTATKARTFNTGPIKPGRAKAVQFTRKGTFAYHCNIHPFMKGTVVVR